MTSSSHRWASGSDMIVGGASRTNIIACSCAGRDSGVALGGVSGPNGAAWSGVGGVVTGRTSHTGSMG
jgi:hypothetical protein